MQDLSNGRIVFIPLLGRGALVCVMVGAGSLGQVVNNYVPSKPCK
jgi:hypothetical protein